MDFLDISSLGFAYRYDVKIKEKFQQKMSETLDLCTQRRSKARETLAHKTQDKERTTNPDHKQRSDMKRQRRTPVSGVNFIKTLGTTLMNVA